MTDITQLLSRLLNDVTFEEEDGGHQFSRHLLYIIPCRYLPEKSNVYVEDNRVSGNITINLNKVQINDLDEEVLDNEYTFSIDDLPWYVTDEIEEYYVNIIERYLTKVYEIDFQYIIT